MLHAPTFAGQTLGNVDANTNVIAHDIGESHSETLPDHMQQELNDAFDNAISEIDSMHSRSHAPTPERLRFGDLSGVIAAQPLA